jgi:rod shape-determining protein MreD
MRPRDAAPWTLAASLLAVLVLTLMPLPESAADFRPYWAALVMIYWNLEAGRLRHLGQAFAGGLVLDVLTGSLLGQHALSLVIISYLVERFRYRIRFFPPWQQAAVVMLLLFNDRIVQLWIIGLVGDRWPNWQWWCAPVLGLLIWPWLFLLLDALRQRERRRGS